MSDTVIRVEKISKLYRLGEVGTGSLAHDVNRWWHKVRGKEDPYLKIGEVNDRTKSVSSIQRPESSAKKRNLTTEDTESTEGGAGGNQRADSAEFLEGHSQAGLQMDSEKIASIRSANDSRASGEQTGSDSESVIIRDIRGKKSSAPATSYSPLVTPKAPPSDWVYALKDVSFEVKRGEVLGIIGRNGAGKSTLLKILSRVTTQSSGQIKVKGRIASLLEVGTGFHPELTGRENIFLNGAILGMRKAEIARKFDEIVEFSGCARYIDTPVKRYSSGMYVRLAFAVAAHLEPEILIVDEVLAVGDAEFQKKCLGKMKDVAGHGRTILFVSHNMAAIQHLCSRAILLQNGKLTLDTNTDKAVESYLLEMRAPSSDGAHIKSFDGTFSITHTILRDASGEEKSSFKPGEEMVVEVHYDAKIPIELPYFWVGISSSHGVLIGANMLMDGFRPPKIEGIGFIRARLKLTLFPQISYFVIVGMRYKDSKTLVFPSSDVAFFNMVGSAAECGFPSPVADQHLSGNGGIPIPYEWELSDGTRHSFDPFAPKK